MNLIIALSEIVITFDPHAKEIGGPSFLSYAIGRLGPMNAAQAQLMAATLNYIIDSA